MAAPRFAEELAQIEIERVPAEDGEVVTVMQGLNERHGRSAAVRITVTGDNGAVISDVWTRDRFWMFFQTASQVLTDG